jgi:hypothetical protein
MTGQPDIETLTAGLSSVLSDSRSSRRQVTVLSREPVATASSFPAEVVECRLDDGSDMRLFCKYGSGQGHVVYRHRGGTAYEAEVYRHVLRPCRESIPAFYGAYEDETTGETWLILKYLDESVRISRTREPTESMALAARWIGRFHAENERRVSDGLPSLMNEYDFEYYVGWSRRTSRFAVQRQQQFPWVPMLCERFETVVPLLLARSPTIIHGEYYPANVLFRGGSVYPVDWESAAIAAGEIDLASLVEGWATQIARRCETEYRQARWPEGAPADFERVLDAARLYLHFRWLGDRQEWTMDDGFSWRFDLLHSAGQRLGLL